MLTLADRLLLVLGALLAVLGNEMRLFNDRPRIPTGAFHYEMLLRGAGPAEPVFLSLLDMWTRAGLLTVLALAVLWTFRAGMKELQS